MISLRSLLDEIARCLPEGGEWCTLDKAETLAAMIVAARPRLVVEIGVWEGGSLIPMLLALQHNGCGRHRHRPVVGAGERCRRSARKCTVVGRSGP